MLTIVIGTGNRLSSLKMCLDAIIDKIGFIHEIVVVDAGSTDGTLEYVAGLGNIRLISDGKPLGQARSLNQVFRTLNSKYICWLSDDNVVLPGALDLAVKILDGDIRIGMVALKVKDVRGPNVDADYIGGIWQSGVLNCNQGVIRTNVLRQVNYFDETYGSYGIDADLTTKVLLASYKVVYTKNVAIHHYRDYQSAPGVMGSDQRSQQFMAAKELYSRKFNQLTKLSFSEKVEARRREKALILIERIYMAIKNLGLNPDRVLGYSIRDWTNVLLCRYISWLDLWHNRNRPYYLTQMIDNILPGSNPDSA